MKRTALVILVGLVLAGLAAGVRVPAAVQAQSTAVCPLGSTPGVAPCPAGATVGLQNAISDASAGETLTPIAGCYYENLDIEGFSSPGLTIIGAGAGPHTVSSSPDNPAPNDPCLSGNGTTTTTQGTYIDGVCDGLSTVYTASSYVTIENVTIQDGCIEADNAESGGGLMVDAHASVQISQSWIFANAALFNPNAGCICGAGVSMSPGSAVQLLGDQVINNVNDAFGAGGVLNFSLGYTTPSSGTPPRSSVSHARPSAPNPGGVLAAYAGLRHGGQVGQVLAPPPSTLASMTPVAGKPADTAPVAPSGSQAPGIGLTLSRSTIQYNFADFTVGGIENDGTAQLSFVNVLNNYGGSVGGIGEDPVSYSSPNSSTQINHSLIQGNVAAYFSVATYSGLPNPVWLAGGLSVEHQTTLWHTPVKNNTYPNGGSAPKAGGIMLDGDNDNQPWENLSIEFSPVSGNSTPQCAFGGVKSHPFC